MADWDPFAEQSEGLESAAGLPSRPPPPAESLSLGEFLERLDEICGDPEARRAVIDQKMKPLVASAIGPQAPVFCSVLSSRFVRHLADVREERVKAMNLVLVLQEAFSEVAASMSGGLEVLKPDVEFSGSVVMIFGFGGSSLADLTDCVPAYRQIDAGCLIVLMVMAGGEHTSYQLAEVLESTVNAWADAPGSCRPRLLVHMFSNMGFMTWNALLNLWEQQVAAHDEKRLRSAPPPLTEVLKAVVLDSCPDSKIARKNGIQSVIQSVAAGFALATAWDADGRPLDAKASQEASMLCKCEILHAESPWRKHLESMPEKDMHNWTRANTAEVSRLQPSGVPMQFIYSENDAIIHASGVERHILECEGQASGAGSPLPRRLKFPSSGHCLHKQVHQEAYWAAVGDFWQLAMEAS